MPSPPLGAGDIMFLGCLYVCPCCPCEHFISWTTLGNFNRFSFRKKMNWVNFEVKRPRSRRQRILPNIQFLGHFIIKEH